MRLALLAISLLLSSCNGQVHQTRTENEIEAVTEMANKAMNVTQKILEGASAADVQAVLGELTTAARAVLDATRDHWTTPTSDAAVGTSDAYASAAVSACARVSVTELLSVKGMSEKLRPIWALGLDKCLALAAQVNAVSSKEAVEEIGFAVNMIYPVALVAYVRAGFEIPPIVSAYRSTNETIIKRLGARCSSAQAARLTSCGVALAVQPRLGEWARTMGL